MILPREIAGEGDREAVEGANTRLAPSAPSGHLPHASHGGGVIRPRKEWACVDMIEFRSSNNNQPARFAGGIMTG
jgi:hypothetical protein